MAKLGRMQEVIVPSVLGMSLKEGLISLSGVGLCGSIINERENEHLVPGTILEQFPEAGVVVKTRQAVNLLISRSPLPLKTPACLGKSSDEITLFGQEKQVLLKEHFIEHHQPEGICVAQWPLVGEPLRNQTLIIYYSKGVSNLRIVPSFAGYSVQKVQQILNAYGIAALLSSVDEVITPGHQCIENCLVKAQKPLAGTILELTPGLAMHFLIEHQELL